MPNLLKILHLADSHIGADLPDRPRTRRWRRGDDFVRSYRRVIERAREFDVDLVLHGGDVFDHPTPGGPAVAAAAEPLLELAADGFPIVIVPGNHERSAIPDSLLFFHPNIHIVREPTTFTFNLRGRRVAVASIPCVRRSVAERFDDALDATNWAAARVDVNVLLLHQTFESATCGPVNFRFRPGPDVLDRACVPADFHYVALGHIHRTQTLEPMITGGAPIVYAGSPDRISFAERDEPKGCVLIRESAGRLTHEFIEHDVRPMIAAPIDISGMTRSRIEQAVFEQVGKLPEEAVAVIRLTGQTTRREFRRLTLPTRCAAMRPNALLTVSSQALEFVPERTFERKREQPAASAFESLPAVFGRVSTHAIDDLKAIPKACGTYAMRDAGGRLLYIGKAKDVRARVRSHLRNRNGTEFFVGWTRQIAAVEVRPAGSELEALLVEAELVRRLSPPFNRQMRSWSRYAYLARNGKPYGQLSVYAEPPEDGASLGPYRSRSLAEESYETVAGVFGLAVCPTSPSPNASGLLSDGADGARLCERYYAGLCSGPCADRVSADEYSRRLALRDGLLAGRDERTVLALEADLEARVAEGGEADETRALSRVTATLRAAFEHGAVLSAARALLGGMLVLPGEAECRTVALLAGDGVRFAALAPTAESAMSALKRFRVMAVAARDASVPKAVADALCTVVRYLRRFPEDAVAMDSKAAAALDADALLRVAAEVS